MVGVGGRLWTGAADDGRRCPLNSGQVSDTGLGKKTTKHGMVFEVG